VQAEIRREAEALTPNSITAPGEESTLLSACACVPGQREAQALSGMRRVRVAAVTGAADSTPQQEWGPSPSCRCVCIGGEGPRSREPPRSQGEETDSNHDAQHEGHAQFLQSDAVCARPGERSRHVPRKFPVAPPSALRPRWLSGVRMRQVLASGLRGAISQRPVARPRPQPRLNAEVEDDRRIPTPSPRPACQQSKGISCAILPTRQATRPARMVATACRTACRCPTLFRAPWAAPAGRRAAVPPHRLNAPSSLPAARVDEDGDVSPRADRLAQGADQPRMVPHDNQLVRHRQARRPPGGARWGTW